jgi:hypothetical protein
MRPVVLQMTISLDGYVAGPNGEAAGFRLGDPSRSRCV